MIRLFKMASLFELSFFLFEYLFDMIALRWSHGSRTQSVVDAQYAPASLKLNLALLSFP